MSRSKMAIPNGAWVNAVSTLNGDGKPGAPSASSADGPVTVFPATISPSLRAPKA